MESLELEEALKGAEVVSRKLFKRNLIPMFEESDYLQEASLSVLSRQRLFDPKKGRKAFSWGYEAGYFGICDAARDLYGRKNLTPKNRDFSLTDSVKTQIPEPTDAFEPLSQVDERDEFGFLISRIAHYCENPHEAIALALWAEGYSTTQALDKIGKPVTESRISQVRTQVLKKVNEELSYGCWRSYKAGV